MSIFESIKADKKFGLGHWRYRAIHWFYGVNPKTKAEGIDKGVPRALYEKQCPQFHLSNLIVITSPFILTFKIVKRLAVVVGFILETFATYYVTHRSVKSEKVEKETPREELEAKDKKLIIRFLKENPNGLDDFNAVWFCLGSLFKVFDEETAKAFWEKHRESVRAKLEAKKLREKKARERMAQWVNVSRILIKGLINVFYTVLIALVGWFLWTWREEILALPVWIFSALWNFDVLYTLMFLVQIFLFGILTALVGFLLYKLFGPTILSLAKVVGDAMVSFFGYIFRIVNNITDFFKMFYEENCPNITIVEGDAEILEEVEE